MVKRTNKKLFNKTLKLHLNDFQKLVNILLREYRKRQPPTYNFKAIIKHYYNENNKLQSKNLGYIRDKIFLKNIVDYLLTSPFVIENYDPKNIETIVEIELRKYLLGEIDSKENLSNKIFGKLEKLHDWNLLFPLGNIEMGVKTFRLGNYKIIKFTKYHERKWKETINNHFDFLDNDRHRDFFLNWFKNDVNKVLKNATCARMVVTSGDSKTALVKAKEEMELFMSCIKYISHLWYPHYNQHRIFYFGDTYNKGSAHIGFSETGGPAGSYENDNPLPYQLTKHNIGRMLKYGSEKISEILKIKEGKKSHFQKRILEAIGMYGGAISDQSLTSSYVRLMTILEYLLIKDRESISINLCERSSFILSKIPFRRKDIHKNIKELYKIRCDIVHDGKKEVSEESWKMLKRVVFNIILLHINCHKKFNNKKDFINTLNDIKFGEKISFMRKQIIIGHCW